MNILFDPLLELENYHKLITNINQYLTPVSVSGVYKSQKSHLINSLMHHLSKPSIIITHSEMAAREIYEDMQYFLKSRVKFYPAKDIIFYNSDVHSADIERERLKIIENIIDRKILAVVLTVESLTDKLIPISLFKENTINLKVGSVIEKEILINNLVNIGYRRCEIIENPGQFAVRGGIIDILPSTFDFGIRIEYWDNEIDSIRLIDLQSQRSVENIQEIKIFPASETIIDKQRYANGLQKINSDFQAALKNMRQDGLIEQANNLSSAFGEILEEMQQNIHNSHNAKFVQYFFEETVSFFNYFSEDILVFFDEPLKISEHITSVVSEYEESITSRIEQGHLLPSACNIFYRYKDILRCIDNYNKILLLSFEQSINDFDVKSDINFSVRGTGTLKNNLNYFENDLRSYKKDMFRTIILAGQRSKVERLANELTNRGITVSVIENPSDSNIEKGQIILSRGSLHSGFCYDLINLIVITDSEIFGEEKKRKRGTSHKKNKGDSSNISRIENFSDLKIDDYVVHETHGIGKYKGIEKITISGTSRDYFKIMYDKDSVLYIPTTQIDLIQRYIGGENVKPKLNKLGTSDWIKTKSKVRKIVADIATELVELYAKRQCGEGFQCEVDTVWQTEFEDLFPYEETEDQLCAIEDVKRDMESKKVMDRLICGDVGFGKTEVAIRAAFKAVENGKQVAYLVPTTILAKQHYNTFSQRMINYSICIKELSRLRTRQEQKSTIEGLIDGSVNIVIGTHRLLSKDIAFKNLGLIIVDEEQRFGVTHKEKLKRLKGNVDVLTLSATPIPRTLHMSLINIRDLSLLSEPPHERLPIQTYVLEYNTEFIKAAIRRELTRGGQVFYLYNRVETIVEETKKLKFLLPDIEIAFAHGQLAVRELENIILDFVSGNIDVLVCTTIIETGLDIPNVNTIIIQDADRMGLAQLYQLRGRVGRSNKLAYAYLMYKKDKVLHEIAEKRLQTIKEFTEFGSGFKIAMRDLEIRGAGNLLGAQQHGHMDAVGYDLYCKFLEEAVKKEQGQAIEESIETSIDININAYIPESYIKDEEQKLELYKKIALIENDENYMDVEEELEDRFGNIPKCVKNLLLIASLKALARNMGIVSVNEKKGNIILTFDKLKSKIDPDALIELIKNNDKTIFFTDGVNPYITCKHNFTDPIELINYIKGLLLHVKY